jgi:Flp pilus assembly protein CpaB
MKMIAALLILAAALGESAMVQAQDSATTPAAVPAAVSPNGPNSAEDQKMVCRSGTLIGSRIPAPRVCKTQWQWDEARRIARHDIAKDQIRGITQ